MAVVFYEIGNLIFMEIHVGKIWEYYFRDKEDIFDYFKFSFGSDKPLNKMELEVLMNNGYFEKQEEE